MPIIDEDSEYQMVMFPMSHLVVGSSCEFYDLVDLAIPIHLKPGQVIVYLSSVAHGGGAPHKESNLPICPSDRG